MSKLRAVANILRLDKLVSNDPLTIISFYLMIALNVKIVILLYISVRQYLLVAINGKLKELRI